MQIILIIVGGLVVLKLFIVDLGNTGTVAMIISFLGVGASYWSLVISHRHHREALHHSTSNRPSDIRLADAI